MIRSVFQFVRAIASRFMACGAVYHSHPDWDDAVGPGWRERIMNETVTDRFHAKQGRTIARWTVGRPGRELIVYLKRHYRLPRLRGWLAWLLPNRAWSPGLEEWQNLEWARSQGLPVARAVAVGQTVSPTGKLQGFLAVEELAGMIGLHEAVPLASRILSPESFAAWKRGLTQELARLSRELHRRRAFHKDLYFCHFYIAEADTAIVPPSWRGRVVMIDFHRLGRHPLLWGWYLLKDIAQLWHSSEVPGVTARDRLRFWKQYRSGHWGREAPPPDWYRHFVRWKWALYQRTQARRAARAARTTMTG